MFGKTKDLIDGDLTGIFGDEEAADRDAQLDQLRSRIDDVEGQISSQFTSMAAYAQIAQEQIELARAESKASAERTESRLTQLIERERSERLGTSVPSSDTTGAPKSTPSDIDRRLDVLEASVESIKVGINDCLVRQKALADAITALFRNGESPVADSTVHESPAPPITASTDEFGSDAVEIESAGPDADEVAPVETRTGDTGTVEPEAPESITADNGLAESVSSRADQTSSAVETVEPVTDDTALSPRKPRLLEAQPTGGRRSLNGPIGELSLA